MNLGNLKTYVPAKLYIRGMDYFEKGFVEHLMETSPNRWHALVAGTGNYEVAVNLAKDGTIVGSYCTCPFESDSLCKHEVAVCLAIREAKEENGSPAVDVQAQLKGLKKAELLEILGELVEKQPAVQLYPHLLADYPNEVNEIYTGYIYSLIEPASNRKAYRSACREIKGYKKALGAEAAAGLIDELKFMYPKRSALLDELGKIE